MKAILKKRALKFILIAGIAFIIFIITYFSFIKIYEDLSISIPAQTSLNLNIAVTGRTVFNDERLLFSPNDSTCLIEANYFKNIYIRLKEPGLTISDTLTLLINGNSYHIKLNRPDFSKNGYQYFDVHYSSKKSFATKIKYILKCNLIHISDKFKYSISLILFFLLPLYILLFVIFLRLRKNLNPSKKKQ